MDKHHTDVPHYGHQVAEEAQMATQLLEQVKADPNLLTKEATEEERLSQIDLPPQPREDPPPKEATEAILDTEDTSSDSSSIEDLNQEESSRDPLTFKQLQAVKEGATALHRQPTLESLIKYPTAYKQGQPSILASQDRPPSETPAAQLAIALVQADILEQMKINPEADISDMPELEHLFSKP